VDNVFVESTSISSNSWDKKKTIKEEIEAQIMEPVFNGSNYSFRNNFNNESSENKRREDNCYIFEYVISLKKEKSTYEKMKEKFNLKGRFDRAYYNSHSIHDIQEDRINSSCVEIGGSYIHEPEFDEIMIKQGKALVEHIEKVYGVKIKLGKLPGYRERGSGGFGFDTVEFKYEIKKVVDAEKLKVETTDIDFVEKMIKVLNKRDSHEKEGFDILKLNPNGIDEYGFSYKSELDNITVTDATFGMARSPIKMYVIKNNEEELLEDYEGFKRLMLRAMWKESSWVTLNSSMLMNFKKLMPKLYEKLFGTLPAGVLPVILHSKGELIGFPKQCTDLDEVYEKFILPEMR
jgi:hypothetical protein